MLPSTRTRDTATAPPPPDTTEPTKEKTLNSPLEEVDEDDADRRAGGEVDDAGDKRLSQAKSSTETDGLDMAENEVTKKTQGT